MRASKRAALIIAVTTALLTLSVGPAWATENPEVCVPSEAVPAVPDVLEQTRTDYQRYSWTGGPIDSAPTEVPPSENWQANTTNKTGNHADDPVGVPFQRDNPGQGNADWFYWTATVVVTQPFVPGTPEIPAVVCPPIEEPPVEEPPVEEPPIEEPPVTDEPRVLAYTGAAEGIGLLALALAGLGAFLLAARRLVGRVST